MMRSLIALAAACCAGAALADPTLECSEAGSQIEIGACVRDMERRVETGLEFVYGQALASARGLDDITARDVAGPALEASQAAWLAYRDAHCDFVGTTFGGGSGTGIGISACRVELGRLRIDALLDTLR